MVDEGFSSEVITPGVTTAEDLEWWFRDKMMAVGSFLNLCIGRQKRCSIQFLPFRMQQMNVTTWFHPTVDVNRPSGPAPRSSPLQPGDMLHTDIGITALNMNTDTQHLGYILKANESSPPAGLLEGLKNANRMQELTRMGLVVGLEGDEILGNVREKMKEEGLKGLIYSHPIGDYGHSAGPLIGMTNLQECECRSR